MPFHDLSSEVAAAPVVIVTGPTATGKTRLAVELSRAFQGEIISADSRQLYRGLDLGTGKDLEEYGQGENRVPLHLVDVVSPECRFDLFKYLDLARQALTDIHQRGHLPVICGGTPLYIAALLDGYAMIGGEPDNALRAELEGMPLPKLQQLLQAEATPELIARTDMTQSRRVIRAIEIARHPECSVVARKLEHALILAPKFQRSEVRERIRLRLQQRFDMGMTEEVRRLHENAGISWEQLEWFGLEYRYISRYLKGELSYDEMFQELLNHIRQFAKRQDIWFRKLEREGKKIHWIEHGNPETAMKVVSEFLRLPLQ